jgi:two-component SAPR family response regulator
MFNRKERGQEQANINAGELPTIHVCVTQTNVGFEVAKTEIQTISWRAEEARELFNYALAKLKELK